MFVEKPKTDIKPMLRRDNPFDADVSYTTIVSNILARGELKENRTSISAITIPGAIFQHDMSLGFPLITTKKMPFKVIATELEFFIKGLTDKYWLQSRNCHIWDEWASPAKVRYGHDEETKRKMSIERDLGPIYGFQWRHFNASYEGYNEDYSGKGVDQLENVVKKLKNDPSDRRMIVSAWNPQQIYAMALPPCHYSFQITVINKTIHLLWNQRSVDTMIGLPFNIASYGILLHLLAKESNLKEGILTGFLGDVHIYQNHIEGAKKQIERDIIHELPTIKTEKFSSIFNWEASDTTIHNYTSYPSIKFDIAV